MILEATIKAKCWLLENHCNLLRESIFHFLVIALMGNCWAMYFGTQLLQMTPESIATTTYAMLTTADLLKKFNSSDPNQELPINGMLNVTVICTTFLRIMGCLLHIHLGLGIVWSQWRMRLSLQKNCCGVTIQVWISAKDFGLVSFQEEVCSGFSHLVLVLCYFFIDFWIYSSYRSFIINWYVL